ncbi:hypothetical protein MES4922_210344 [Mesorhizobium ventifaucium]|uniref:Uncharacterized protein n=1 Tax=Mesorhizobium ventifaucium TaxID=666020 RepID=A0ABN8JR43_9HYPH|nr:hypothetical protein MES4922_210344 [Mesorhizobium ventifaucium]
MFGGTGQISLLQQSVMRVKMDMKDAIAEPLPQLFNLSRNSGGIDQKYGIIAHRGGLHGHCLRDPGAACLAIEPVSRSLKFVALARNATVLDHPTAGRHPLCAKQLPELIAERRLTDPNGAGENYHKTHDPPESRKMARLLQMVIAVKTASKNNCVILRLPFIRH